MVARRPSRLALRFRTAARRPQTVMNIGQAARRAAARRVKPARSLREGRWADGNNVQRQTLAYVLVCWASTRCGCREAIATAYARLC